VTIVKSGVRKQRRNLSIILYLCSSMIHGYYTNKCVVTIYTDGLDVLDMVFTIGWGNYFIDIKRKTSSCIGYLVM
jgi:NADPH-dependent 7-cyano-7-deazaguanine reductase QueF